MSHYSRTQRSAAAANKEVLIPPSTQPLRIAFLHPDLGIGGAERLVVDAAIGLQKLGHHVEVFTSWHDPARCFEETKDGTLKVHVLGNSIFPRSLAGGLHALLAIARQLHLTFSLLLAIFLWHLSSIPLLSLFLLPPTKPCISPLDWSLRRTIEPFDLFIVDQLSACIPLLRWVGRTRVLFYCHHPDLLASHGKSGGQRKSLLKSLYRVPLDWIEENTTGESDKILVNSEYTSRVFRRTFRTLNRWPRVVYPGVDTKRYAGPATSAIEGVSSSRPTIVSINRFEDTKDVGLAIEAFALARKAHPSDPALSSCRLVLAGGYDPRVSDNISTLSGLQDACAAFGLSYHTYDPGFEPPPAISRGPAISSTPSTTEVDVLFLPNVSHKAKLHLLRAESTKALLYTPSNEHLGIVPLEAAASGLPVLCADSGGPKETVVDAQLEPCYDASVKNEGGTEGGAGTQVVGVGTGLLRPPIPELWASALYTLLTLPAEKRAELSASARKRAEERFSLEVLAAELDKGCRETYDSQRQGHRGDIWAEEGFLKAVALAGVPAVTALVCFVVFCLDPYFQFL